MKADDLYNAVTALRDDQILEGEKPLRTARAARFRRLAALLAVVVLAGVLAAPRLLAGTVSVGQPVTSGSTQAGPTGAQSTDGEAPTEAFPAPEERQYTLSAAVYPPMVPYANERDYIDQSTGRFDQAAYTAAFRAWADSRSALRSDVDYTQGLEAYLSAAVPVLMEDAGAENRVVSPLNVYMALAMLAETTDGASRQELLRLLNAPDLSTLRARANALWRANYSDDGRLTSVLAASVWLRDDLQYKQSTVDTLSNDYYASVFSGQMGSAAYTKALQNWMNTQTRGLLSDQIRELELRVDTAVALVTTICFRASWAEEFYRGDTRVFHAPTGEQSCDFMLESGLKCFYTGDGFTAAGKTLTGAEMYFLLPEEGLSPAALLEREEVRRFLTDPAGRESTLHEIANVTLAVPEFDVSSQLDLVEKLKTLGVTAIFDRARSDFSPLTDVITEPITVGEAKHGARVTADRKGVTGAAYTEIQATFSSAPEPAREVELILDRPFLFVITNSDGLPLFVGVVNTPVPQP